MLPALSTFDVLVLEENRKQKKSMKRWEQREDYKPSGSVKAVSISHCPPEQGTRDEKRGTREVKMEKETQKSVKSKQDVKDQ